MNNAETVKDIFNTFTERQKNALYYIVGLIKEWKVDGLMRDKGIISQGTIDNSYRGSIHAILINTSKQIVDFEVGDKIAQLVVVPCLIVDVEEMKDLDSLGKTDRGENGFGSTGRQ